MDKILAIKQLFPTGEVRGIEVNNLNKNTVPLNCQILCEFSEPHSRGDRRDYYLVKVNGTDLLAYFRVCTAMKGSGYDEYAVIYGVVDEKRDDVRAMFLRERVQRAFELFAKQ